MIRSQHRLSLKNISLSDQKTMGLGWAWKAGARATYVRDYGYDLYHKDKKSCSLVRVYHVDGEKKSGREIWVFDMFLEGECIWNS